MDLKSLSPSPFFALCFPIAFHAWYTFAIQLFTGPRHPLLRSNDPPSDQEVMKIRKEIQKLEAKYEKLAGHPDSRPPSHLLPLRRIPREVLQEIMFFATMSNNAQPAIGRPIVQGNLGELGQLMLVCQRWKQAILGACFLWQHIPLRLAAYSKDPVPPKDQQHMIRAIRTRLEGAGSLPVWLEMHQDTKSASECPAKQGFHELILGLLFEHTERWGRVCMTGPCRLYEMLQETMMGARGLAD